MEPGHLLEYVSAREDNEQHEQDRNRKQQRELLANEGHENGHANSEDKQKPEAKKTLRVKTSGVSQPLLVLLQRSEQGFGIGLELVVLIHRLVIEQTIGLILTHHQASWRERRAGFGGCP